MMLALADNFISESFKKNIPDTDLSLHVKEFYKSTHGYVYLVHAVGTNRYKIGRTNTFTRRCKELEAQSPFPLDVINYHWSPNPRCEEQSLHSYFKQARVYGEWFSLNDLTEQESKIMADWHTVSLVNGNITKEMREKYRWSRKHAVEIFESTHCGKAQIIKQLEPIFIEILANKVKGAAFVLSNRQVYGMKYDLFFCSVLDLMYRTILACNSVSKLAYACIFLEREIPEIVNNLLQSSPAPDSVLKTKEAINSALASFLNRAEGKRW